MSVFFDDERNALKRIKKEMNENKTYDLEMVEENIFLYKIKTQIRGLEYDVMLHIPKNYPFKPISLTIDNKELKQFIYELDQDYFWLEEKKITLLHEIVGSDWKPSYTIVNVLNEYETKIPLFIFSKKIIYN